jgi:deoxyhypusine monooxygenase
MRLVCPSLPARLSCPGAETCQIAAQRVRWAIARASGEAGDPSEGKPGDNPFQSIDPAPSAKKPHRDEVPAFRARLLDASLPLFERYKAMFSLRNNGGKAAVLVRNGALHVVVDPSVCV